MLIIRGPFSLDKIIRLIAGHSEPSVFGLIFSDLNYHWKFVRLYRVDETALRSVHKKGASNIIQYRIVSTNLTFSGL